MACFIPAMSIIMEICIRCNIFINQIRFMVLMDRLL